MKAFEKVTGKSLLAGGLGAGYMAMRYGKSTIRIAGTDVPAPLLAGIAMGSASILSDIAHDAVFPALHVSDKTNDRSSAALALGAGAAGNYAIWKGAINGKVADGITMEMLAVGAGAEILSSYLWYNFIAPMSATNRGARIKRK